MATGTNTAERESKPNEADKAAVSVLPDATEAETEAAEEEVIVESEAAESDPEDVAEKAVIRQDPTASRADNVHISESL